MYRILYKDASDVAVVIISIAVMLLFGFLLTRVTKKLRLPNVTAYIVCGMLLGPFCLDLVPQKVVEGSAFLPDIALAFIAFSTGEFFRLDTLRKNGFGVVVITVFESLAASAVVFCASFFLLRLSVSFSVVLAALAAATAPASTVMTIRQTGAKGDFVDTLLQVVALDDIVGLLLYSLSVSLALFCSSGERMQASVILLPILKNLAVLLLGGVFGLIMKLMIQAKRSDDNRLIITVALLFFFCGICALLGISPLLGCMSMGTVYINLSGDDKLFRQINYFSPPILLLFFVRSGISFDLGSLFGASASVGSVPLVTVGIVYFLVRILGKYGGAYLGCLVTGKSVKVRNYLGFALVPQAGVAIGLAALGARTLGGETGRALETIILASSVLYELVGPALAKLSLYLSGSYSDKLEELVSVPEKAENGETKSSLELLIERIQKIQEEIPERTKNEDELAFTGAAEEQYEAMMRNLKGGRKRR